MRLTREENPETIRRYGHIKPARGWRTTRCLRRCPGTTHTCTLVRGHRGPHVAHGLFSKVVAAWDSGSSPQGTREVVTQHAKRPIGLRDGDSVGPLEAIKELVVRLASSAEEIALLVFFIACVWFAIDWLRLILG